MRKGIDAQVAERATHEIWDGLFASYFEGTEADELVGIDKALAVLAEVERCCFAYGVSHTAPADLRQRQRERIELCADRLTELLPEVGRLDF